MGSIVYGEDSAALNLGSRISAYLWLESTSELLLGGFTDTGSSIQFGINVIKLRRAHIKPPNEVAALKVKTTQQLSGHKGRAIEMKSTPDGRFMVSRALDSKVFHLSGNWPVKCL